MAQPRTPTVLEQVGYWVWGTILVAATLLILIILGFAARCSQVGTDLAAQLVTCKSEWWVGYYIVLKDWQTGIAALIGFGGIAWSTFYAGAHKQ